MFIVLSVIGIPNAIPTTMLLGIIQMPFTSAATRFTALADDPIPVVIACAALAAIAIAKRLFANGPPAPDAPRPEVWLNRLLLDRDIRDREAWIHRNDAPRPTASDRSPAVN
jgi:hypothetical protein